MSYRFVGVKALVNDVGMKATVLIPGKTWSSFHTAYYNFCQSFVKQLF